MNEFKKRKIYNKPYEWCPDYHSKVAAVYRAKELFGEGKFLESIPIQELSEQLILTCETSEEKLKKFDWVRANITVPIINKRTLEILEKVCPNDFQAFPIIIRNVSKKDPWENKDYFLINIIGLVDVLDMEKSVIEYWDENLKKGFSVRKTILKEDSMGDVHIGRDRNDTVTTVVSPTLKKILKKEKIKGVSFLEDDENRGW